MNTDTIALIGKIAGAITGVMLLWVVGYMFYSAFHRKEEKGSFDVNGHEYAYTITDDFSGENSFYGLTGMHGIAVELPKYLPNMIFDAHFNDKVRGMPYTVDSSQRLKLEGDFNKFFAFYAPQHDAVDALSIITPDVMERLQAGGYLFDLEINGKKLMIFSRDKVMNNTMLQQKLLDFTQIILNKIDNRLQSWTDEDSQTAATSWLNVSPEEQIKVSRRRGVGQVTIVVYIFSLFAALLFVYLAKLMVKQSDPSSQTRTALYAAFFFFPVFPLLATLVDRLYLKQQYRKNQTFLESRRTQDRD